MLRRSKDVLLIDGVKYHLHVFQDEEELQSVVEEHSKEIFGEDSIFFGKKKISSLSGIGSIPDGYAIAFQDPPSWYVVEVELSTHPMFEHVVSQLSKFIAGIESNTTKRRLIDYMDKEISSQPSIQHLIKERFGEVYRFLSDLIYEPPIYLIVVDEKTKDLEEVVKKLQAEIKVLEIKTFEREGVGIAVHAHLFEPLYTAKPKPIKQRKYAEKEITSQSQYILPILEVLVNIGGRGKTQDILKKVYEIMENQLKPKDYEKLSGGEVRWKKMAERARFELVNGGYLRSDSPRGVWEITDKGRKLLQESKH